MSLSNQQRLKRQRRITDNVNAAIQMLAECHHAAAATLLSVSSIDILEPETAGTFKTAALVGRRDGKGRNRIVLNAEFCDLEPYALACILLHEIMHHVMKHLVIKAPGEDHQLCNIVADAFINHIITELHPALAQFFMDFYSAEQSPHLFLRPQSAPSDIVDEQMYGLLYSDGLSEGDLYTYLARCGFEQQKIEITLIGSHPLPEGIEPEDLMPVTEELRNALEKASSQAAGKLRDMLDEWIKVQSQGRVAVLDEVFRNNLVEAMRSRLVEDAVGDLRAEHRTSPITPERLVRSDTYMLLAGIRPLLWRMPQPSQRSAAAEIYIDVSGSMNEYLSFVYGCILAFEEYLDCDIHTFSNKIADLTKEDLRSGKVRSTYGTDFDCVVEHLLESDAERAIMFTDGHASLADELTMQLERSQKKLIAVITPNGSDSPCDQFCASVHNLPEAQ